MKKMKMNKLLSLACVATLATGIGVAMLDVAPTKNANAETTHTEEIFMINGASIRYSAPAGIRFTGYVKDDGDLSDNRVGFKISVDGEEKDFSTENIDGATWKWAESDVEGYQKFQVAITGIPETKYATEMTAQAYVDGVTSAQIVTRSIATVANAALAADTLEKELSSDKITALEGYVNDAAVVLPFDDADVTLSGGSLTWNAVDNAKGYLVQFGSEVKNVPNNGAETYSVSIADFEAEEGAITMLPYGDGNAYTYAATPYTATYADPAVLASFNNTSYESAIVSVDGWTSGFKKAPVYEDGTVSFGVYIDDYRALDSMWTNIAAFTVTLPKALDLESGYDGIKTKVYVSEVDAIGSVNPTIQLELFAKDKKAEWYGNANKLLSTAIGDGTSMATGWLELFITNEQLQSFGYTTGDTVLTFGFRGSAKTGGTGFGVIASIDYIEYYSNADILASKLAENELANFNDAAYTPLIVSVDGWTSGFKKAPVYEDGTVSFGVYIDDYRALDSMWTNIAAFTVTLPKALDLESGYDGIKAKVYVSEVDAIGSVNPTIQLELFAKDKKAEWYGNANKLLSTAIGDGTSMATGWLELFITNEQLQSFGYTTGDTVLTFGFRGSAKTGGTGFGVIASIDYIEYYSNADILASKLAENELANFNDAAYTPLIGSVDGWTSGFKKAPAYEDGTVSFGVYIDDYRALESMWTNIAAFTVTLPKALDLESGYDGIKTKVYVSEVDAIGGVNPTIQLELFAKDKKAEWYGNANKLLSTAIGDGTSMATGWLELSITNEQLQSFGYTTGDTVLTFGFRSSAKTGGDGFGVIASIDYIEYYGEIEEDEPVVVDKELVGFNDASDVSKISNVAGYKYTAGQHPYNGEPTFEGKREGTVYVRLYNDDYTCTNTINTNLAAFTVTLTNALNLESGYEGIKIRIYLEGKSEFTSATLEMLANGKNTEWNQNPSVAFVDITELGWVELFITNAQLAELGYKTGDTVLTFGVRGGELYAAGWGNNANISIDYIEYYKDDI